MPFAFSRAVAVYDGIWKELILQFKFYGRRELARPLGWWMAGTAMRWGIRERAHALVPVPLHPRRLERRGYNQALELAIQVRERTGVPVVEALARTREPGGTQSLRQAVARRRSMRGAFVAWEPALVEGLTLVVVDDVYTTGATLDAASRALLRAGAREVLGLVAAVGLTDLDLADGGPEGGDGRGHP
ncbi:MAG: ComF family protein [Limnochordaceae bacterium]|nr:ComF family protein [Limnochordaceae bacterium]